MNRPWMPLYIADYLADTAHLRVEEHGSYLLLIMHYWRTGGLPNDDAALARISRMTRFEWKKAKPAIAMLFQEGWKHKRIEFELTENARISAAGHIGGKASAEARRKNKEKQNQTLNLTTVEKSLNDHSNDQPTKPQALQPQPQSPLKEVSKRADAASAQVSLISPEATAIERELILIVGHDPEFVPPAWHGAAYKIQNWLTNGWPREAILTSAKVQMAARGSKSKPNSAAYFEKGIADFIATQNSTLPQGTPNGFGGSRSLQDDSRSAGAAAGRLAAAAERGELTFAPLPSLLPRENENDVRLLPKG